MQPIKGKFEWFILKHREKGSGIPPDQIDVVVHYEKQDDNFLVTAIIDNTGHDHIKTANEYVINKLTQYSADDYGKKRLTEILATISETEEETQSEPHSENGQFTLI